MQPWPSGLNATHTSSSARDEPRSDLLRERLGDCNPGDPSRTHQTRSKLNAVKPVQPRHTPPDRHEEEAKDPAS